MTIDISAFSFDPDEAARGGATDFVTFVPSGLAAKSALLEAYRHGLKFPAYFGGNWDALSDCLRDLSWVSQRRIVIIHTDLPGLPAEDKRVYLEILAGSVAAWKPDADHELAVAFPGSARAAILDVPEKTKISA
jgi:RNAse (barnase) inhibitor barstar